MLNSYIYIYIHTFAYIYIYIYIYKYIYYNLWLLFVDRVHIGSLRSHY